MSRVLPFLLKVLWKLLRMIALLIPALYIAFCVFLFIFQRSILYFPTSLPDAELPFIEQLSVDGAELNLSVHRGGEASAIIYFGGNAEDVSYQREALAEYFPNHGIYLSHYRSYGGSSGQPSEAAFHADAQAVYNLVKSRHRNILVIGRSLGTGVAIRLAAGNPVEHLVLVSPYDSILNVARRLYPFVPTKLILLDEFQSELYAPAIVNPVLVLKAESDSVIPHTHTDALLESFSPGIARVVTIEGTDHNSIWDNADSYLELLTFTTGNSTDRIN